MADVTLSCIVGEASSFWSIGRFGVIGVLRFLVHWFGVIGGTHHIPSATSWLASHPLIAAARRPPQICSTFDALQICSTFEVRLKSDPLLLYLKADPLLKCTSKLSHFWTPNKNFFWASIRFYRKKKLQLTWRRLLPEIQLRAHFRLTHCLLLALPVVNFSKTEDSEHEHCYLSHSLQTFQNRGIHIYMYFNHSL